MLFDSDKIINTLNVMIYTFVALGILSPQEYKEHGPKFYSSQYTQVKNGSKC